MPTPSRSAHNADPDITEALRLLREGTLEERKRARDKLLDWASRQFRNLASRMLDQYARLRQFEQTGDILNQALIALSKALEKYSPETHPNFCRLVAKRIRLALVDLSRKHFGPLGMGTNQEQGFPSEDGFAVTPAAPSEDGPQNLAEWTEFHELIEQLPEEQREVVEYHWYQGLTIQQIADYTGKSYTAVRRRWREARESIGKWLGPQHTTTHRPRRCGTNAERNVPDDPPSARDGNDGRADPTGSGRGGDTTTTGDV